MKTTTLYLETEAGDRQTITLPEITDPDRLAEAGSVLAEAYAIAYAQADDSPENIRLQVYSPLEWADKTAKETVQAATKPRSQADRKTRPRAKSVAAAKPDDAARFPPRRHGETREEAIARQDAAAKTPEPAAVPPVEEPY